MYRTGLVGLRIRRLAYKSVGGLKMKTDVAIIGAGPGGTSSALFLARRGIKSIIIEKELFPRFHVGESLTGECGNLLRMLGLEEEMNRRGNPIKYGVKVYGPDGKGTFWVPVMARSLEKGLYEASTWQVRRSDYDQMLLETAVARGVAFVHGQALKPLFDEDGSVHSLLIKTCDEQIEEVEAKVLVDASGQATFLSNSSITGKKERGKYDKQIAIFAHVKGAVRDPAKERDNTQIFYQKKNHWAWFIPIDKEVVSIGVVVPGAYFQSTREMKRDFFSREIRELNPDLARRVRQIEPVEEVYTISNYSYHIKEFTGKYYLCVGDAHRFIDPIFSFGVHVTIHEAYKAAEEIDAYLNSAHRDDQTNPFVAYQEYCEKGTDVFQDLLDGFWEHPLAFAFFAHERYVEDFRDMFAGRVYAGKSYAGLEALRTLNAHLRENPSS
jgi:flavin-dependent dehydrogenase